MKTDVCNASSKNPAVPATDEDMAKTNILYI